MIEDGVPIDVLWFRIGRMPGDSAQVLGTVNYGKALILINRSDYFQAGLIIAKGSYDEIKARGIDALRADIRKIAPFLGKRVNELHDWEQIKVLTVQINRLQRWYRPGLLCIGDAAHAMSPAGGVGINSAIQDAVAAANLLTGSLQARSVPMSAAFHLIIYGRFWVIAEGISGSWAASFIGISPQWCVSSSVRLKPQNRTSRVTTAAVRDNMQAEGEFCPWLGPCLAEK